MDEQFSGDAVMASLVSGCDLRSMPCKPHAPCRINSANRSRFDWFQERQHMPLQERRHVVAVVAAEIAGLDVHALPGPLHQLRLQREVAAINGNAETGAAAGR